MLVAGWHSALLCYGIATVGVMGATVHHCGTFLRHFINKKPVVLYLDAVQTEVLCVKGKSELFKFESFKKLFSRYQKITLYEVDKRQVTDAKELDELQRNIKKNMLHFTIPTITPGPPA